MLLTVRHLPNINELVSIYHIHTVLIAIFQRVVLIFLLRFEPVYTAGTGQNIYWKLITDSKLKRPASYVALLLLLCRLSPKITKKSPKNLKSKFRKPVPQFFPYWYIDHVCQVLSELVKNCRSSDLKKKFDDRHPGRHHIL